MTRIKPLTIEDLPRETQTALEFSKQLIGYVPGSVMIMGHWPELLGAFRGLVSMIYGDSAIHNGLKRIIGAVTRLLLGVNIARRTRRWARLIRVLTNRR